MCGKRNCVTVYIYQTFIYSLGSLSRVKKHGNCFVCVYVKFVRIKTFSYFGNFFIDSICYRFGIQIFIKDISIVIIK